MSSKYAKKTKSAPSCAVKDCAEIAKFIKVRQGRVDWLCTRHAEELPDEDHRRRD